MGGKFKKKTKNWQTPPSSSNQELKSRMKHQCHVPPDLIYWEEHSTARVLTKPESNHKQSDKPNLRGVKIIGQYSAKSSRS